MRDDDGMEIISMNERVCIWNLWEWCHNVIMRIKFVGLKYVEYNMLWGIDTNYHEQRGL